MATTEEIRSKLEAEEVSPEAIALLATNGMLKEKRLVAITSDQLVATCGITMGDALSVKDAYPLPSAAHPTAGNPLPSDEKVEKVSKVRTDKAPPGTTATKKLMFRTSELAAAMGLPEQAYKGCTWCSNDLTVWSKTEGISDENIKNCPFCTARFIMEKVRFCYADGTKLPSSGQCVTCGANYNDQFERKAMVLYVRRQQSLSGDAAIAQADLLMGNANLKMQVIIDARDQKWVETAEEVLDGKSATLFVESPERLVQVIDDAVITWARDQRTLPLPAHALLGRYDKLKEEYLVKARQIDGTIDAAQKSRLQNGADDLATEIDATILKLAAFMPKSTKERSINTGGGDYAEGGIVKITRG